MANPFRVLVIGGVAAGPKIASKVARLRPDAEVTLVEKDAILSYAGCGLPYFISGDVLDEKDLMAVGVGVVRDSEYFRDVKNVRALTLTEALEIDRREKRVRVRDLRAGMERWIPYDKLALATGARPVIPAIPGADLANIFVLKRVEDAAAIRRVIDARQAAHVVIGGGGLIGVESAEALAAHGCCITVVEMLLQILSFLDPEMAAKVERRLAKKGVRVLTNTRAEGFVGDGRVQSVMVSGDRTIPADLVILSVGVRPHVDLAKAAGIELGPTGAIQVDHHMRTSDPDVYAAGDCCEVTHLLTGKPAYVPLGSTANKQGRVAAANIAGGNDRFPGVLGTIICKVFDFAVGHTGLSESTARILGYDVVTALTAAADRAHYYPTSKVLFLKMIVNRPTGKILGVQAVGPGDADKRIDVAATAISAGLTVEQVSKLDLCYAPPFSSAMDNIITTADVIKNKLDGQMRGLSPLELRQRFDDGDGLVLLDVQTPPEYNRRHLPNALHIPLAQLRTRLEELPRDREIVLYCASSVRAYEAFRILRNAGFETVSVLDGSLAFWPYEIA